MTRIDVEKRRTIRDQLNSVYFNGVNQYGTLPYTFDPSSASFTLSMWAKLANKFSRDDSRVLWAQQNNISGTGRSWLWFDVGSSRVNTNLDNGALVQGNISVPFGKWHHFLIRHDLDSTEVTIYVDNVLHITTANSPQSAVGNHVLGAHKSLGIDRFYGWMTDVVFIENYAVSDSERDDIYYNGVLSSSGDLTVRCTFSDGAGNTITDESGEENDVTLVNSPTWDSVEKYATPRPPEANRVAVSDRVSI